MQHQLASLLPVLLAVLCFGLTCFVNALAAGLGVKWGVFRHTTGDVSDKYHLEITPAGWTFSIWGVIYLWQMLFLGYALSTLCRKGPNRGYLYCDTDWMPSGIYYLYAVNMASNASWLVLWDRRYLILCLVVIAVAPFTLYLMLILSCRALVKYKSDFVKAGMAREVWMVRYFVQNAFGIYATWTSIATLLNMGITLSHVPSIGFNQSTVSTVALIILTSEVVIYAYLDFYVFQEYVKYLFTPYLVVPFALLGSIAKNWNPNNVNSMISAGLLAVSGLLLLVKITKMQQTKHEKKM